MGAINELYDSLDEVLKRFLSHRRNIEREVTIGYEDFIGVALLALYANGAEVPNVRHRNGVFVVDLSNGQQAVVDTTSNLGTLVMDARRWSYLHEVK